MLRSNISTFVHSIMHTFTYLNISRAARSIHYKAVQHRQLVFRGLISAIIVWPKRQWWCSEDFSVLIPARLSWPGFLLVLRRIGW